MNLYRENHIITREPERIITCIMKDLLLYTNALKYMETNQIQTMTGSELISHWRKRTYKRCPLGKTLSDSISQLRRKTYEWMNQIEFNLSDIIQNDSLVPDIIYKDTIYVII